MSARETYKFGPYVLRPAGAGKDDATLAKTWTSADPDHCSIEPDFWLLQDGENDSYVLCDQMGPLYFARLIMISGPDGRAVEMHIQFPPDHARKELRQRIAAGLLRGLEWLERMLRRVQVHELYFDSRSDSLIQFSIKRMGFHEKAPGRLAKQL
jgi:hypothetical protein